MISFSLSSNPTTSLALFLSRSPVSGMLRPAWTLYKSGPLNHQKICRLDVKMLMAGNQPWWEHLHCRHERKLKIRASFPAPHLFSQNQLLHIHQHTADAAWTPNGNFTLISQLSLMLFLLPWPLSGSLAGSYMSPWSSNDCLIPLFDS